MVRKVVQTVWYGPLKREVHVVVGVGGWGERDKDPEPSGHEVIHWRCGIDETKKQVE